jgi:hypothetical protein
MTKIEQMADYPLLKLVERLALIGLVGFVGWQFDALRTISDSVIRLDARMLHAEKELLEDRETLKAINVTRNGFEQGMLSRMSSMENEVRNLAARIENLDTKFDRRFDLGPK